MVLHNILIIGLTWVITTVVLGIIYAIICFIIGVICGAKSMEIEDTASRFEDAASRFEEEYSKDCRDKLKWYRKMPKAIQWLLLPIALIVCVGVGLYYIIYYIFN